MSGPRCTTRASHSIGTLGIGATRRLKPTCFLRELFVKETTFPRYYLFISYQVLATKDHYHCGSTIEVIPLNYPETNGIRKIMIASVRTEYFDGCHHDLNYAVELKSWLTSCIAAIFMIALLSFCHKHRIMR